MPVTQECFQRRKTASQLRRTALSLLKQETTARVGIKNKRLNAGWDDGYLEKVLMEK